MRKFARSIMTVCLVLVMAFSIVAVADLAAAGIVLNVPADYPTIQEGIDAAAWGDTVLVAPGVYIESIALKQGVIVQSDEGAEVTTIRGDGSRFRFTPSWNWTYTVFGADNSTISGFTIKGSSWSILNYYASPTITNNIITGASWGIYNHRSSPTIDSNAFIGNSWGINNHYYSSSPTITNNIIKNNVIGVYNDHSSPTITNNIITDSRWVGIFNYTANSWITNNIITGAVDGIYNIWHGTLTITYNNLWGNRDNDIVSYRSNPTVANNISVDPMFVDPTIGDFNLQEASLCIDAGMNDAPGLPETDFNGNPRIADGNADGIDIVDMGAIEFGSSRIPETPEEAAVLLEDLVDAELIDANIAGSLLPKLETALTTDNPGAALGSLGAFINQINAQRGKKIDDATADELIAIAEALMAQF